MDDTDPASGSATDPLLPLLKSLSREDPVSARDRRAGRSDPPHAAEIALDLRLWSLVTFRTVTFTLALALFMHLRGSLQSSLARLDTLIGFGVFLILWTTTAFATRIGVRHRGAWNSSRRSRSIDGADLGSTLEATVVAGGWNGVFIFLGFTGGTMLIAVGLGPGVITVLFASVIGSVVAFALGGIFGCLYGLVESALFAISARIADWIDAAAMEVRSPAHERSQL
jgi:hypothetical protein